MKLQDIYYNEEKIHGIQETIRLKANQGLKEKDDRNNLKALCRNYYKWLDSKITKENYSISKVELMEKLCLSPVYIDKVLMHSVRYIKLSLTLLDTYDQEFEYPSEAAWKIIRQFKSRILFNKDDLILFFMKNWEFSQRTAALDVEEVFYNDKDSQTLYTEYLNIKAKQKCVKMKDDEKNAAAKRVIFIRDKLLSKYPFLLLEEETYKAQKIRCSFPEVQVAPFNFWDMEIVRFKGSDFANTETFYRYAFANGLVKVSVGTASCGENRQRSNISFFVRKDNDATTVFVAYEQYLNSLGRLNCSDNQAVETLYEEDATIKDNSHRI